MKKIINVNEKGLTLIELLATIVILAIIAAIAIPSFQIIINNQRDKAIITDIVQMVETSKMQMTENECKDEICEYSPTNNEISFSTSRFLEGKVDFTDGNTPSDIKIWVNLESDNLKGKKREKYIELLKLNGDKLFTEEKLLEALNY